MSSDFEPKLFIKDRGSLVAGNDAALELLGSIRTGNEVELVVKNRRHRNRLKAYWALLRECVNSTGCAPSTEVLHSDVKVGTGYIESVLLKDGSVRVYPASVSFAKMSEQEFITYFRNAEKYLAEQFGFG